MQTIKLRRDHDDAETYHLLYEVPSLSRGRPLSTWCMASVHADVVQTIFGNEVNALANELGKGESIEVRLSASVKEQATTIEAAHASSDVLDEEHDTSDDDTQIITEQEAAAVLSEHTAGVKVSA
jgi:hypothetical protein